MRSRKDAHLRRNSSSRKSVLGILLSRKRSSRPRCAQKQASAAEWIAFGLANPNVEVTRIVPGPQTCRGSSIFARQFSVFFLYARSIRGIPLYRRQLAWLVCLSVLTGSCSHESSRCYLEVLVRQVSHCRSQRFPSHRRNLSSRAATSCFSFNVTACTVCTVQYSELISESRQFCRLGP